MRNYRNAARSFLRPVSKLAHRTPVFVVLLGALLPLGGCSRELRPDIVLVTVDTLRPDRLGVYGGTLATPNIDRIGRTGVVVETAVAPFGRTTQSIGSLLTGMHPLRHGADGLGMRLPDGVRTLAEELHDRGYATAAFVSNVILQPGLGFEQGFDLYSNPRERWVGDSAESVTAEASAWLTDAPRTGRPRFLWVHYLEPHWPYTPPPGFSEKMASDLADRIDSGALVWGDMLFDAPNHLTSEEIARTRRMYDGEVLATDRAVGELLNVLEKHGIFEHGLLIFASDHGESLGEHEYWFGHGEYIYEQSLRVPLLLHFPSAVAPGRRLDGVVRLEDVAPTVLELLDLPPLAQADGISIAPALRASGSNAIAAVDTVHLADHLLVRAENPRRPVSGREGRWQAIRSADLKLIRIPGANRTWTEELYDVRSDPREQRNLISSRPADAERLRRRLADLMSRLVPAATVNGAALPVPDQDALRSLGYAH